jgi:hypothetical protein
VEKAALISAVPPLMVKTAANWLSPNQSGRMFAKIKNSNRGELLPFKRRSASRRGVLTHQHLLYF